MKPSLCVEIGRVSAAYDSYECATDAKYSLGSGVVSTFLSILLGPLEPRMFSHATARAVMTLTVVLGVDINPHACAVAARTAAQNDVSIEIVRSNLLNPLSRMFGKVDLMVFNPPYVPTDEVE